jgi:hypothetical protein
MGKDRLAEARILAEDLLADIELTRMGAEQILLKGVRLARLIGDETSLRWLELELHGYEFTDETRSTLEQMRRTFKHKDGTQRAYVIPLGSIKGNIRAEEKRLTSLGAPSLDPLGMAALLPRLAFPWRLPLACTGKRRRVVQLPLPSPSMAAGLSSRRSVRTRSTACISSADGG